MAALGLWFSLALFLMAATSLRRFTTPAVTVDDMAPAAAPNQIDARTAPDTRSASTQERNWADKTAKAAKQGTADANSAPPAQPQKSSLRSDAGAAPSSTVRVAEAYGRLPLSFESNQGQTDRPVKFLAHGSGYTLFLTDHEAVLTLQAKKKPEDKKAESSLEARNAGALVRFAAVTHRQPGREAATTNVLRMNLVAANPSPEVVGAELLPGRSNYFVGKDSSQWHTDVPTYAKVRYQNVYPGVDLIYYGNQRQLEYDFVVAPGADPKAIKLSVAGASKPLAVDADGNLVVHLSDGEVRFHKPVVYQKQASGDASDRRFVDGRFVVKHQNLVAFQLGAYDRSRPLVIDPTLSYSTYLGGSGFDAVNAIAVDSSGDAYVAGITTSTDFPGPATSLCGASSACGTANSTGFFDSFVAELNPGGTALVYSTYLGGSGDDTAQGIAVDGSGNAYVTGNTGSPDFPQVQAIAAACVGGCTSATPVNAFVTEIGAGGSSIVYSTRLGGSTSDSGQGIAVDSSGNAYVAGLTESADFPSVNQTSGTCVGACTTATKGTTDSGFVAEIKAGSPSPALAFSSLLGGSGSDMVFGVALDPSLNIYVTGITRSADFPIKNPIAAACMPPATCGTGAGDDAFVTELTAGGSSLQFSTYLGGSGTDDAFAIAVDSSSAVYVTGATSSTDFPKAGTVTGACSGKCGTGMFNAFVTKLRTDGPGLVYSTYLGGSIMDQGDGIAVDSSGDATVTGMTMSKDFPTASPVTGACVGTCGTGATLDAFVTQVNGAGTGLSYSTYIGGSDVDAGFAVALDSLGNAYVAGQTSSTDFKTTTAAFQTACGTDGKCNGGNADGFVTKIAAGPVVSLSGASLTFRSTQLGTTSASQNVTLTNTGSAALNLTSITASGDFVLVSTATSCPYTGGSVGVSGTCTIDVGFKPTALGARAGSVSITDNAPGTPQSVSLSGTGIDTIAPTVTILANPTTIRNRNGALIPVVVSGSITDSGSGVNASTAAFNVVDEYGLVQPSGAVTLGAGGSYSFNVMLQASRQGSDADGRQYTITVSAKDNAGNLGTVSTVVTVLHDN